MTQIPYRMPRELAEFMISRSGATNEVELILTGQSGALTKESLVGITTLGSLCMVLKAGIALFASTVNARGEHLEVIPELLRQLLLDQAAISKRLIDEIVSVYTAHERN